MNIRSLFYLLIKLQQAKHSISSKQKSINASIFSSDEDIAKWAWSKFLDQYGSEYSEAFLEQKRKDNWDRLLAQAEVCKIRLTKQPETTFRLKRIRLH